METNGLHTLNSRRVNWIGQVLSRNRLVKHVIEVKMQGRTLGTEIRVRKRKQLLDDFK